jgi:hypothetical protein
MLFLLLLLPLSSAQINVSSPQAREIYEQARIDEEKEKDAPPASADQKEEKAADKKELKAEVKKEIKEEIKKEMKNEIKEEIKEEVKKEVKEEVKQTLKEEKKEEPQVAVTPEEKTEKKEEAAAEAKAETKVEAKPETKPEAKAVVEVKKEVIKEEKKEEPVASTIIPNSYGGSYQSTALPYGPAATPVKIKDISQGSQPLPSYGTQPAGSVPKPYGSDPSKQKINPYMP